jgi:hypothetical protein
MARLLGLPVIGLLVLSASGCSLKAENPPSSLSVRLSPSSSVDSSLLAESFSKLIGIASVPSVLSDLNCFAVSARGDGISGMSCGKYQIGILDGFHSGIDSTFRLSVPVSSNLTFDAFGMQFSGCPFNGDGTGTVVNPGTGSQGYFLGSVTPGDIKGDITIPVSFSSTATVNCGKSPYTILSEPFNYAGGTLSTRPSSPFGSISPSELSTGGSNVTVNAFSAQYGAISQALDTSRPYISFSYDINLASTTAVSGSGNLTFIMGQSNDSTLATPTVIGCSWFIPTGGPPYAVSGQVGGVSGLLPSGSGSVSSTGTAFTLKCEIQANSSSNFDIVNHIIDSGGDHTTGKVNVSVGGGPFATAYIGTQPAISGSFTGSAPSIDNYTIQYADSFQY